MDVKRVRLEDAEQLLKIYEPYVRETAISFEVDVPEIEEFVQRIEAISCRYPYLKAVENGKILGYAYAGVFKNRKAYDWSVETTVYVSREDRQKGVGKMLYNALEKELKEMGVLNMNACIASPSIKTKYLTNDSYEFHKKMGFEMVGRFHNSGNKFGEWFDMIWMEKMIGEHNNYPEPVKF